MSFINIMHSIRDFFLFNRRSGTTTLINKIAEKENIWILVANNDEVKLFPKHGDKVISILDLDDLHLMEPRPILVDNHTIIKIVELVQSNTLDMQKEINDRNDLLKDIRDAIEMFGNSRLQTTNRPHKTQVPGNFFRR